MGKPCRSVFRAPFPMGSKDMADHQCSRGKHGPEVRHYCGCSYEWTDAEALASLTTKESRG